MDCQKTWSSMGVVSQKRTKVTCILYSFGKIIIIIVELIVQQDEVSS